MSEYVTEQDYAERLGRKLRAIRDARGLTLSVVEEQTQGAFKAVVVGSYERGQRAIHITRLKRLCDFYGVSTLKVLDNDPIIIRGKVV